jgi:hypothetical protein
MNYSWNDKEYTLKNKINILIDKFNNDKSNLSLLVENLDPYELVNDSTDVFLFCALMNCEEICIYWIKNGYKNRYYKDNKNTLYYLLTLIKSIRIINEVFIYWKLNDLNFFKLFYENFDINENQLMLLYYYMNNKICPCKMLMNNSDILSYYYSLKNNKTCICGECINNLVNNEDHDCSAIRCLFQENKYIISYICQIINCKSCLNYFLCKNTLDIKKTLHINNKKVYFKVLFYYSKIIKENGDFEDCIEYDEINEGERFYKCTSNVPHYYKEINWIKWCNHSDDNKSCCVCKLKIDNNLYIKSEKDVDLYSYNKREYIKNITFNTSNENEKMYLVNLKK